MTSFFFALPLSTTRPQVLQYMQGQCDAQGTFPATFVKDLKPWLEGQERLKANTKALMQFAAFMRDEAGERGVDALATVLPINQKAILEVRAANAVFLLHFCFVMFAKLHIAGCLLYARCIIVV